MIEDIRKSIEETTIDKVEIDLKEIFLNFGRLNLEKLTKL